MPAIVGFHDLETYLSEFDSLDPTSDAGDWVEFVNKHRASTRAFDPCGYQVIHGDCKVNNLLFKLDAPKVLKVIDLDTLMWGASRVGFRRLNSIRINGVR